MKDYLLVAFILTAVFEYGIERFTQFMDNLDVMVSQLTFEEKIDLIHGLMELQIDDMNSYPWHRRFEVVKKLHELI